MLGNQKSPILKSKVHSGTRDPLLEEKFELKVPDFDVELHCALRSVDFKGDEVDLGECLLGLKNAFHLGGALDHQKFVLLPDKRMPAVVRVRGWLEFSLWFEPYATAQVSIQLENSFRLPVDVAHKGDVFLRAVLAEQTRTTARQPPAAALDWHQQLEMSSDRVSGATLVKVELVHAADCAPQAESVVAEWSTTLFQLRQEHDYTHLAQGVVVVPKTVSLQPAGELVLALAYRGPQLADPCKTLVGWRRRQFSAAQHEAETSAESREDQKKTVETPGDKRQTSGAQRTQSEVSSESCLSNDESPRVPANAASSSSPHAVVMHGNPMASEPVLGNERAALGPTHPAGQDDARPHGYSGEQLKIAHLADVLLGHPPAPTASEEEPSTLMSSGAGPEVGPTHQPSCQAPVISQKQWDEHAPYSSQQEACPLPGDEATANHQSEIVVMDLHDFCRAGPNLSEAHAALALSDVHRVGEVDNLHMAPSQTVEDLHADDNAHMAPKQMAVDLHEDDNMHAAASNHALEGFHADHNMFMAPNHTTEDLHEDDTMHAAASNQAAEGLYADDNVHMAPNQTTDNLHENDSMHLAPSNQAAEGLYADDNVHMAPNQTTEDLHEDDNMHGAASNRMTHELCEDGDVHMAPDRTAEGFHEDDRMHAAAFNQAAEDLVQDDNVHMAPNQTAADLHADDDAHPEASSQTTEDLHEETNVHAAANRAAEEEVAALNVQVKTMEHHAAVVSHAATSSSAFFMEELHDAETRSSDERTDFQRHSAQTSTPDSSESEEEVYFAPLGAKRPADDFKGTSPLSARKESKQDLHARAGTIPSGAPGKCLKRSVQEVSPAEVELMEPNGAAAESPHVHDRQAQFQAKGICDEDTVKALEQADAWRVAAEREVAKLAAENLALAKELREAPSSAQPDAMALVAAREHEAALAAQQAAAQAIRDAHRLTRENELAKALAEEALDKAQAELRKEQENAREEAALQAEQEQEERLAEFKGEKVEAVTLVEETGVETSRVTAEQDEASRLAAEANSEEQTFIGANSGRRAAAAGAGSGDYALVAQRRAREERRKLQARAKQQARREAAAAAAAAKQRECLAEEAKRRAQENAKRRAARLAAQNRAQLARARAAASAERLALMEQQSQAVVVKQRQAVYAARVAAKHAAAASEPTPERSRDGARRRLPSPSAASTPPESPATPLPVSVSQAGDGAPREPREPLAEEKPSSSWSWSWWGRGKGCAPNDPAPNAASAMAGGCPATREEAERVRQLTDALYGDVHGVLADLEAWRREQHISPTELWSLMDTKRSGYLEVDEFVSFIRGNLQPPDFPGCTAVQLRRIKHLLLASLGPQATVREGWLAAMLRQHKDVETWNTPHSHHLRALAQALGPQHESKVQACLGDGAREAEEASRALASECKALPPQILHSALAEVGRVCEKAGKVLAADVALVLRIVWHYQLASSSSSSTTQPASSAESSPPLWRRILGAGPPSAQSSPGDSVLAMPAPASCARYAHLAAEQRPELNIESPEVTSVTLFDEARAQEAVDLMYGSVEELFAALEMYRSRRRYRAVDMFMEIDKDRSGELDIKELIHFVRRVVPDVSDVQMRRLYRRLDRNRDGKVTYKEVADYMSAHHDIEHNVRKNTSHMRNAVIDLGRQMDDVFRRLARWAVDDKGQISHEELHRNLAAELPGYSPSHLRYLMAELLSVVDQSGRVAVYDVIVVFKAVWLHEVQVA